MDLTNYIIGCSQWIHWPRSLWEWSASLTKNTKC